MHSATTTKEHYWTLQNALCHNNKRTLLNTTKCALPQ